MFLKSLLNLLQYCLCFVFSVTRQCRILTPWQGIKPTPPALEGEVLTTGQLGKSPDVTFFKIKKKKRPKKQSAYYN